MEDQAVEVVGDVGQHQFRFRPHESDGADEQAEAVLLVGKDMLHMGTDRGLGGVGARDVLRHWLACRFAAVDAACHHVVGQPLLVRL